MSESRCSHVSGRSKPIRCDHDGLKMAEVQNGHLILRAKHHGETHVMVVPLESFFIHTHTE